MFIPDSKEESAAAAHFCVGQGNEVESQGLVNRHAGFNTAIRDRFQAGR